MKNINLDHAHDKLC